MQLGNTMMKYLTLTFLLVFVFYMAYLLQVIPRAFFWNTSSKSYDLSMTCGPFTNSTASALAEVGVAADSNNVVF